MMTAKSAGSPAFLPPELCVSKHGDISGKAADIWSMGVSLYCLRFGKIPFERTGVLELYEAIKNDEPSFELENEPGFLDLMTKLLEKNPNKRIKMPELREHLWVTKNGKDPLLSAEENCADLVQPPSILEVNHAITTKMRNLLVIMKAVKRFKNLIENKRPGAFAGELGKGVRTLRRDSTGDTSSEPPLHKSRSVDLDDRRHVEQALAAEGVHHDMMAASSNTREISQIDSSVTMMEGSYYHSPEVGNITTAPHKLHSGGLPDLQHPDLHEKGHAHDPMDEDPLYLGIGTGGDSLEPPQNAIVADSPTAADFNIYDTAYQQEVERIREAQGHAATVYLTRRVDAKKAYKADENMINAPKDSDVHGTHAGFKNALNKAREKATEPPGENKVGGTGRTFTEIAAKAIENTKMMGKDLSNRSGAAFDSIMGKAAEKRKERAERKDGPSV